MTIKMIQLNVLLGSPVIVLLAVSVVLSGLMAGFFFAYSLSVVLALETLSASEYVTVMQEINDKILNVVFGAVFFGTVIDRSSDDSAPASRDLGNAARAVIPRRNRYLPHWNVFRDDSNSYSDERSHRYLVTNVATRRVGLGSNPLAAVEPRSDDGCGHLVRALSRRDRFVPFVGHPVDHRESFPAI